MYDMPSLCPCAFSIDSLSDELSLFLPEGNSGHLSDSFIQLLLLDIILYYLTPPRCSLCVFVLGYICSLDDVLSCKERTGQGHLTY